MSPFDRAFAFSVGQGDRERYHRDYWISLRADELPPMLAMVVFDAAVSVSVGMALRWLHEAVELSPSRTASDEMVAEACWRNAHEVAAEFTARRFEYTMCMVAERDMPAPGLDWARRVCRLAYQA